MIKQGGSYLAIITSETDVIRNMGMRSKINQNQITDGRYTTIVKKALKYSNKRRLSKSKNLNYRWK